MGSKWSLEGRMYLIIIKILVFLQLSFFDAQVNIFIIVVFKEYEYQKLFTGLNHNCNASWWYFISLTLILGGSFILTWTYMWSDALCFLKSILKCIFLISKPVNLYAWKKALLYYNVVVALNVHIFEKFFIWIRPNGKNVHHPQCS